MKKNMLLALCAAVVAQGLQAAKSVEVTTTSKDMAKYNYAVEACESGTNNCGSRHSISKEKAAKVSAKDRKDAKGKTIKIKSYDLNFYRNGKLVGTLAGIAPESVVVSYDGKAYLQDNANMHVDWIPSSQMNEQPMSKPAAVQYPEIDAERRRYYGLDNPSTFVAPPMAHEEEISGLESQIRLMEQRDPVGFRDQIAKYRARIAELKGEAVPVVEPKPVYTPVKQATPVSSGSSYYGRGANYPGAMDLEREQARPVAPAAPTPRYVAPKSAVPAGYENVHPYFYN